jgi:hypothetical protein
MLKNALARKTLAPITKNVATALSSTEKPTACHFVCSLTIAVIKAMRIIIAI